MAPRPPVARGKLLLRTLLALLVALPTYLVVVPCLLVLRLLLFLIFNLPCMLLAMITRRRSTMRVEDAFMLQETKTNRCNIVAVVELDGPPLDLSRLSAIVDRTFVSRLQAASSKGHNSFRWPRFQQRPVNQWGHWHWEETQGYFDITAHVREEHGIDSDAALAELLGRMQSEAMDLSRPLWDVVLVRPGMGAVSTVVFRVHHAMGDGIALVRMLLEALDGGSQATAPPSVGSRNTANVCSLLLQAPLLGLEQVLQPADRCKVKPAQLTGTKRVALVPAVALQRVKDLAGKRNSTVTAVIAACFARALASGEQFSCWVPVSLTPSGQAEMRNDLAIVLMHMDSSLATTDAVLQRMKSSWEGPATRLIIWGAMHLLPLVIAQPFFNFISDKATGLFSSVPGPATELSWDGHRVASLRFLAPQRSNVGLGFSAVSYAGSLRSIVSADSAVVEEPASIASGWVRALEELEQEVV